MVYARYIELVMGESKPTNIPGGDHLVAIENGH